MSDQQKYGSREERDRQNRAQRKPTGKVTRGEYARQNALWLEQKAQEEGVCPLPQGVYYKVLAQGDPAGPTPQERSVITVHYTGRLTDGRVFDGSRGGTPLAIRLSDLIQGWIVALRQMHVGDRWELYIPAEMGYGKRPLPGIPGASTLVFDVELLAIG